MLSRHSAAKEIKHSRKFNSGFIGPQILNFERSLSLSPGPQSSLVRLVKFLLVACLEYTFRQHISRGPVALVVFS